MRGPRRGGHPRPRPWRPWSPTWPRPPSSWRPPGTGSPPGSSRSRDHRRSTPNPPLAGELHRWLTCLVTTLPHERLDTGIAIVGFLCLVPLAAFARDLLGRHRVLARIGAMALSTGALLWVAG